MSYTLPSKSALRFQKSLIERCEARVLLHASHDGDDVAFCKIDGVGTKSFCKDGGSSLSHEVNLINQLLEDGHSEADAIIRQWLGGQDDCLDDQGECSDARMGDNAFVFEGLISKGKWMIDHPDWRNGVLVNKKNVLRHLLRLGHWGSNIVVVDALANALVDLPAQSIKLIYANEKTVDLTEKLESGDLSESERLYTEHILYGNQINKKATETYWLEDVISLGIQTLRILTAEIHPQAGLLDIPSWPTYFHLNQILPEAAQDAIQLFLASKVNQGIGLFTSASLSGIFGVAFYKDCEVLGDVYDLKMRSYEAYESLIFTNPLLANAFLNLYESVAIGKQVLNLFNSLPKALGIQGVLLASLANAGIAPRGMGDVNIVQSGMKCFSQFFVIGSSMALFNYYTSDYWSVDEAKVESFITGLLKDLSRDFDGQPSVTEQFLQAYRPKVFTKETVAILKKNPDDWASRAFLQMAFYL